MHTFTQRLSTILGSRAFFVGVIVVFILQCVWIALSAVYPMAFDEEFHMGIIRIYAEQWSPFLSGQPAGADIYGALQHDPSYLYHYLMSFPYRIMTSLTGNEAVQVVVLRGLNIAMLVAGLILFRKLLLRVGASRRMAHTIILLCTVIPILPFLGGQVNYDNLVMLLIPLLCLAGVSLIDGFRARELRVGALGAFVIVGMAASLVKYPCLPIVAGAALFLLIMAWRSFKGHGSEGWPAVKASWSVLQMPRKVAFVCVLLVMTGLFVQRYGVNAVQYKTPVPDCAQVLSEQRCMSYGPWARNTLMAQQKSDEASANPIVFAWHWAYGMWYRLFFAVNGPASEYATRRPLPVASTVIFVMAAIATIVAVIKWRYLFRGRAYMGFFLSIIIVYVSILWLEQYMQFAETGEPVAINGRYLLPVLPLLLLIWGTALRHLSRTWPAKLKATLAALAIVILLQGPGVTTFILRSDTNWYWPHESVTAANDAARMMLQPLTIEGSGRPH